MTLPDRDTVRAVGRPQFATLLARQGRQVFIRRAGQQDVETSALLIPVASAPRRGETVTAPEVASLAWKVFFKHDLTQVRTPGFTLFFPAGQGQTSQELTPTAPTVDVADQGVVLMVVCSALAERTRVESLTFTIPGVGTVRDAKGNLVPAPGVPLTVPARLSATDDPRVRDMVGADSASVVLVGRWGTLSHPLLRPNGVRWGSTSPLTLDGQAGTLTVKLAYPDLDQAQEAQFGSRFIATWRAG